MVVEYAIIFPRHVRPCRARVSPHCVSEVVYDLREKCVSLSNVNGHILIFFTDPRYLKNIKNGSQSEEG